MWEDGRTGGNGNRQGDSCQIKRRETEWEEIVRQRGGEIEIEQGRETKRRDTKQRKRDRERERERERVQKGGNTTERGRGCRKREGEREREERMRKRERERGERKGNRARELENQGVSKQEIDRQRKRE